MHHASPAILTKRYATADELLYDLEYYIYRKGYGPTNETLGKYIRELFGQKHRAADGDPGSRTTRPSFLSQRPRTQGRRSKTCNAPPPGRKIRSAPDRLLRQIPKRTSKRPSRCVERAAKQGAQIICPQELFRSQYFCQSENHENFKLAEKIPGPSTEALQKLARKHRVVIIASLFEKRAAGVYHNTAAIIDADGSLLGIYRKMHIPDDPLFYEKFYFTPGDLGFRAWNTRYGKIGV